MRFLALLAALVAGTVAPCAGQGSVMLVGGGAEDNNDWSDAPYRWFVEHAPNRKILILDYENGSTTYPAYFLSLGAATATFFPIASTTQADDSSTYRTILAADGIFLRGGDQWQYVAKWNGRLVEHAIREVYARGGVIGGTSAGAMVLSQIVADARITSVNPRTALRNPLSAGISFTEDFLGLVPGILADSHFFARGRFGRLLAMMAVYHRDHGTAFTGVGIDENTALVIDPAGVGEVMGSGTVTILGFTPETRYTLEPGKPLAMANVHCDQLTVGYRVLLNAGNAILRPPSATTFMPVPFRHQGGPILLDGSGVTADWLTPSGSAQRLLSLTSPTDTIGILASPLVNSGSIVISAFLAGQGRPSRPIWLNGALAEDLAVSTDISSCGGYIVVDNPADSVGAFLSPASAAGKALRARIASGTPALFLSNDCSFAADSAVGQVEKNIYGAYYGYMTRVKGLGLLEGIEIMPRLYENINYTDNRASGVFWGMARSGAGCGVLIDAGSTVTISGGTLRNEGATPALLIDARDVTSVDFPVWRDPGKVNPRQNAALINATVHALRYGDVYEGSRGTVTSLTTRDVRAPAAFALSQNYPNPFNPTTNIQLTIVNRQWTIVKIFDLLGREVSVLMNEVKEPGTYTVTFDARLPGGQARQSGGQGSHLASGLYIYRINAGEYVESRKMLLLK